MPTNQCSECGKHGTPDQGIRFDRSRMKWFCEVCMEATRELKVKLRGISQRGKSRVHEHGEYMFVLPHRGRDGKHLFRSERQTWHGEYWKGWFEIGKDVEIVEGSGNWI
jgi:hypothetical protein